MTMVNAFSYNITIEVKVFPSIFGCGSVIRPDVTRWPPPDQRGTSPIDNSRLLSDISLVCWRTDDTDVTAEVLKLSGRVLRTGFP
jgi:hypothetical protein